MIKFAVFMTDNYGSTSIASTSGKTLEDFYKSARTFVHNENIENAFTAIEKAKNWEYYLPEVLEKGQISRNYIYGGKNSKGQHCVFPVKDPTTLIPVNDVPGLSYRFYLGELDRKTLYAQNEKGQEVSSFNDRLLENKSIYFVKQI